MAQLVTSPGTLRTRVVPDNGEEKTIISRWIDSVTTEVANGHVISREGFAGPTVAARFYSMIGTAAYEAWQITEFNSSSLVSMEEFHNIWIIDLFRQESFVSDLISSVIIKVAGSEVSGLTNHGLQNLTEFYTSTKQGNQADALIDQISSTISKKVISMYQYDGYNSPDYYQPVNSLSKIVDIDKWTPEYNLSDNFYSGVQSYLTPSWGSLTPFLITKEELSGLSSMAANPHSFLLSSEDTYDLDSLTLTDTSAGVIYSLDKTLIGSHINPRFIEQASKVIQYSQGLTNNPDGIIRKGTAEFWEDGLGTPFPPGTWLVIGQAVSLNNDFSLEQDAKLFQGLGATVHAAAISAWDLKYKDNYTRPLRAIRTLSQLGLLQDNDPYAIGSQFFAFNRKSGNVDLISGINFETYQLPNGGYSPPFAEFTSGHSTFSASAATFLSQFSDSQDFPSEIDFFLTFPYPNNDMVQVSLEYQTLWEAAEAAGDSRLWGGIHFDDGNDNGLLVGEQIGSLMFERLSMFWD